MKGMLPNSRAYRNTLFATFTADLSNRFTISSNLTYTNNVIKGEFVDGYSNQSTGSFNSWFHRDLDMDRLKEYSGIKTPTGTYPSWNLGAPWNGGCCSQRL